MKRTMLLLTSVIAVAVIVWLYPAMTFSIDGSWWIVRYSDQYDIETAEFVQEAYGGTIIDIAGDHNFNAFGQSFIFIGGSQALSEEASWALMYPPTLAITKPSTQPDVKWVAESWDTVYLETPSGTFSMVDGDYGSITRAYDYTLRRWIVICIGYTPECTAAGARILIMQPELLETHSWIVYEYQGASVSLDSWTLQAFSDYEIVESG